MKHVIHYAHMLAVLALLLAALAPGWPAARADDGRPPDAKSTPVATLP